MIHRLHILKQIPGVQTISASALLVGGLVTIGASSLLLPLIFPAEQTLPQSGISTPLKMPVLQTTHVYLDKRPSDTLGNFYFMLGTQMAARGQILAAEELLAKAIKLLPANPDAFLNYGVVLEGLDRNEEALSMYQHASELQKETPDGISAQTLYTIGLLQDKIGRTDEGIQTLQQALTVEPKNNLIAYDLGVLYSKKRRI